METKNIVEEMSASGMQHIVMPNIKIIGVGGAGNNAILRMQESGIKDVELIAAHTNQKIPEHYQGIRFVKIGEKTTGGLGAGAKPEVGRCAAEESEKDIERVIEGADLLFITCGMGGGTGTGAASVIARIARQKNILTVAVVSKPFSFEGKIRMQNALAGIDELKKYVDAFIVIDNTKLLSTSKNNLSLKEALVSADRALHESVNGILEIVRHAVMINVDMNDIKTILKDGGKAYIGKGHAIGSEQGMAAIEEALANPLVDVSIEGAMSVLVFIVGNVLFADFTDVMETVAQKVNDDAKVIVGGGPVSEMGDEIRVTIVATGLGN